MKIAVFHNLPSGGAKRAIHGFARYLTRKGHVIELFVPSTADEQYLSLSELALRTTVLPVRTTLAGLVQSSLGYVLPLRFSAADLERAEKELADQMNEGDCDVVLVEQDRFTMSPFLLKFLRKPHVYFCQQPSRLQEIIRKELMWRPNVGQSLHAAFRRRWHSYLERKLPDLDKRNCAFARYVVTNSYFSREAILRAYGLNSFVSYLGVDTDIFRPLSLPRQDYVLSVGSFEPLKGYEFLVRSFSRIPADKRPKWIIVSNTIDEGYLRYIREVAAQVGVNLEVRNMIADEDLVRLYNQAKMLVHASFLEPFGLTALEAMACGTPVVAVKEGGIRESVIDNETGLLLERDEGSFAQQVTDLLQDHESREKMGQRAMEAIQRFWTLDQATDRLLLHFNRAIEAWHDQ